MEAKVQNEITTPKKRIIFCRAFGISSLVLAIIALSFSLAVVFVSMTASGAAQLFGDAKIFSIPLKNLLNLPVFACFAGNITFSFTAILFSLLSRFLGVKTKTNSASFVLALVSFGAAFSIVVLAIPYVLFFH